MTRRNKGKIDMMPIERKPNMAIACSTNADDALAMCTAALRTNPRDPELIFRKAVVLQQMGLQYAAEFSLIAAMKCDRKGSITREMIAGVVSKEELKVYLRIHSRLKGP